MKSRGALPAAQKAISESMCGELVLANAPPPTFADESAFSMASAVCL